MKKLVIFIVFATLWAGWFFLYPYYLIWLESFSFFVMLPDYTQLYVHLPEEIFRYTGAFLLQFYKYPALGALVQTLLLLLPVLCMCLMVKIIFRDGDTFTWISFLFLPVLTGLCSEDIRLELPCLILTLSVIALLAVSLISISVKKRLSVPEFLHRPWLSVVLPSVAALVSVLILYHDSSLGRHEDMARLKYLGEHQQWEQILETVSPYDAVHDEYKRKYALLALSQSGRLSEDAFRYGLSGSEDFRFKRENGTLSLNFNILFNKALGLDNISVYNAYEQSLLSVSGLTFDALRTLTDYYLDVKDYRLASKYIDIMSHTLFHGKWVKERRSKLEAIKGAEPEYPMTGERFFSRTFIEDISALATRYPDNPAYIDFLLCALLADGYGSTFWDMFRMTAERFYPDGNNIPRLYQEAVLLVAADEPRILEHYHVDEELLEKFMDFNRMKNQGNLRQAKIKYSDTYWAYVF